MDRVRELVAGGGVSVVLAQAELANLSERRRRVEELVRDKEAVLALRSEAVVRGLDELSPEEKSEIYRLLKLEVAPTPEGMQVSGAILCSESLPFEKASRLLPLSDTSSGRSQYLASATAKALPLSSSSVSVLPLFAATAPRRCTGRSRGVWCPPGSRAPAAPRRCDRGAAVSG